MNQGPYQPYNNQQPLYQQPPYLPYPPRPPYTSPPSNYSGWLLAALAIIYTLSLLFVFIEIAIGSSLAASTETSSSGSGILGSTAVVLLLILHGIIIVKDGHNFFTLFGKLQWSGMKTWLKVVLVFVYLSMWIMSGIYLVQAINHFLRTRRQTLGQAMGNGWIAYKAKTRSVQFMIGIGIALLLITGVTFTSFGAMVDRANMVALLTPTATTSHAAIHGNAVTPTPAQSLVSTTVATVVATVAPTAAPSPTPTPKPAVIPTARPTQPPAKPAPTSAPKCVAVNNNPWCYNFSPGNLIYIPPSGFCSYFNCISSFYGPDDPGDGYIVECNDGSYSQSGGESGACSYHGGVMRPLYSH